MKGKKWPDEITSKNFLAFDLYFDPVFKKDKSEHMKALADNDVLGSIKKGRVLVLGDVHGAAKALEQVLERANFNPQKDQLISLGDIADGWSETSGCVDILLNIQKESKIKPIFIRGNHDVWVYDWFNYGRTPLIWTEQGGEATIKSYIESQKLADKHHKEFWDNQVDWYLDSNNRLFIHAGWYYKKGFPEGAKDHVNAGSISKECHWDRSLFESAMSAHYTKQSFKVLEEFEEVYIGHTALKKSEPLNVLNLWNIDTGAAWSGKLTLMDVDTKEYWQSDKCSDLYPNELGRG